jgi:hypothetical protein
MKRPGRERGFALLMVFLMAACVAILLYLELPRVAFEAERQRELLLLDRGNQFKRAIQVFVTDKINNPTHRYPASLDELETFNNHRYLRHRYVDPMTGKDDWRLVHINGGVLTDSVTTQANQTKTAAAPAGPEFISGQAFLDSTSGANAGGATRAMIRRPSESQPGAPGDSNTTAGGSAGMQGDVGGAGIAGVPGQTGVPGLPGQAGIPGIPGLPGVPGQPGQSGAPTSGQQPAQQPCSAYIGECSTTTTTSSGPQSGQSGQAVPPGMPPNMLGGAPSFGGPGGFSGTPGAQANPQSAAAAMIGNLLTSPRPGGMPSSMPGLTIGGGIAGVASKFEAEGIMVINDRTAINEWEYIFDMTKYRAPPNPLSGPVGVSQSPMGNNSQPGQTQTNPGTSTSPIHGPGQ